MYKVIKLCTNCKNWIHATCECCGQLLLNKGKCSMDIVARAEHCVNFEENKKMVNL